MKKSARKAASRSPKSATDRVTFADAGDASPARSEGQRQLLASSLTGSDVATRLGVARQMVHAWRTGAKVPSTPLRAALEREVGIPAASWERAPVDRPTQPRARQATPRPAAAAAHPSPSQGPTAARSARPSTLDEVTQLLEELDEDAAADGIMPSELARIRDTKTKALALKARIEAQDALFEVQAIARHPAWRRIRGILLDELRAVPEVARRVADRLASEVGA